MRISDWSSDVCSSDLFYDKVWAESLDLCIQPVETIRVMCRDDYDEAHGLWLEEGYEGSIWRADAAYEQKRSKALRKRKEFVDDEFELVAIEAGLGNGSGMGNRKSVVAGRSGAVRVRGG